MCLLPLNLMPLSSGTVPSSPKYQSVFTGRRVFLQYHSSSVIIKFIGLTLTHVAIWNAVLALILAVPLLLSLMTDLLLIAGSSPESRGV